MHAHQLHRYPHHPDNSYGSFYAIYVERPYLLEYKIDALAGETIGAIGNVTLQGTLLMTRNTSVGVRSIEWVCCQVR